MTCIFSKIYGLGGFFNPTVMFVLSLNWLETFRTGLQNPSGSGTHRVPCEARHVVEARRYAVRTLPGFGYFLLATQKKV
jgi:hypothetical protein